MRRKLARLLRRMADRLERLNRWEFGGSEPEWGLYVYDAETRRYIRVEEE